MKYPTNQKRLVAIADAYAAKFNKSSFTLHEVCSWAMKHGLWPVAKRGDSDAVCMAWEESLDRAVAAEERASP